MNSIARYLGLLLALPFMPLAYAVSLLRSMSAGRRVQTSAPDLAGLAFQALGFLQHERETRGLEPLSCARIDVSYGDFDEVRIQFGPETLADGAAEGMRHMGELGNFELTPKIARTVAIAQARQRIQSMKAGL